MLEELRRFSGLPHRCQPIAEIAGVRYINDSKATNPGATRAALEGLAMDFPLVLIAGGQGKGADFTELCDAIAASCKAVVLIGEDAPVFESLLDDRLPIVRAESMPSAVMAAAALATEGDVVLLSPACASFDMFRNFADRGEVFAESVQEMARGRVGND
jgi:UDP-N-acetylmuramoylalanine--D-glutamate ligase